MRRFSFLFACLFAWFLWGTGSVFSAGSGPEVVLWTPSAAFAPGSEFQVYVYVNSDVPLNAFDVEVGYSPLSLEFLRFNTVLSVIDVPLGLPHMEEPGVLRLTGGSSKPFTGTRGILIRMDFRARYDGEGQISVRKAVFYEADGKGTRRDVRASPLFLKISSGAQLKGFVYSGDREAPRLDSLHVIRNPVDGSRLVAYQASDDGSGIQGVRFSTRSWFFWHDWYPVASPLRLPQGTWAFELKFSDFAGHHTAVTSYVWVELLEKLVLILVAGSMLIYILRLVWMRMRS